MKDGQKFKAWSITVKKSQHIIKARKRILDVAEKVDFPYTDRILIATASSDFCRIFLSHFYQFDLYIKPEIRSDQKGLSIRIQLTKPPLANKNNSASQDQGVEFSEILDQEINNKKVFFDELISTAENGTAPSLTLIKWNNSNFYNR